MESPNREQFLEERKGGIGSSDAASLFNAGWGCHRRLVFEKRGVEPDYPRTPAELELFQRGTDLEELIGQKFSLATGLKIHRKPVIVEGTSLTHLDFEIPAGQVPKVDLDIAPALIKESPGVLECKSANEFAYKKMVKEGLPEDYVLQAQASLGTSGYKWEIFAILAFGPSLWRLVWFGVLRDEQIIAKIKEKADETWKLVENGPYPAPLELGDKRCNTCQWRKSCREMARDDYPELSVPAKAITEMEEDDSLSGIVADYLEVKKQREDYQLVEEEIKERLCETLGDRELVLVPTLSAKISYKTSKAPERWDTKALALDEELVRKYRHPGTPSRPLRITTLYNPGSEG